MGWRKRENKAQEFQDSFPKAESTEILSTFDKTIETGCIAYSNRNSHITEFGGNEKNNRVCAKS